MNVTPSQQFLDALAATIEEQASRQAEGQSYYSADAPPDLRPPWPVRPAFPQ